MRIRELNILIPTRIGEILPRQVVDSIEMQTVKCNYITYASPKIFPVTRGRGREHEAENRNCLKKYASNPYTIYIDSDVIFTSKYDVEHLIAGIEISTFDALALDTKGIDIKDRENAKHVIIACFIIKTEILRKTIFRFDGKNCLCKTFNQDCRIKYLDNLKLKEVKHSFVGRVK